MTDFVLNVIVDQNRAFELLNFLWIALPSYEE